MTSPIEKDRDHRAQSKSKQKNRHSTVVSSLIYTLSKQAYIFITRASEAPSSSSPTRDMSAPVSLETPIGLRSNDPNDLFTPAAYHQVPNQSQYEPHTQNTEEARAPTPSNLSELSPYPASSSDDTDPIPTAVNSTRAPSRVNSASSLEAAPSKPVEKRTEEYSEKSHSTPSKDEKGKDKDSSGSDDWSYEKQLKVRDCKPYRS